MLEERSAQSEKDTADFASVMNDLAEMKRRISKSPTLFHLVTAVVLTWSVGVVAVSALLSMAQ
jgi:hypothetical protein